MALVEISRNTVGALVDAESWRQRGIGELGEIYRARKNIYKYYSTSGIYLSFLIEHLLQTSEGQRWEDFHMQIIECKTKEPFSA